MRIIALSLALLLIAAPARAVTIHAEWEYGGAATSYRLYLGGKLLCESFNQALLAMDCEAPLIVGANAFTMTAVGPDGETPHSAPFVLIYDGAVVVKIFASILKAIARPAVLVGPTPAVLSRVAP